MLLISVKVICTECYVILFYVAFFSCALMKFFCLFTYGRKCHELFNMYRALIIPTSSHVGGTFRLKVGQENGTRYGKYDRRHNPHGN